MSNFKIGDWVRIWGKPTRILRVVEANALHTEIEYYDTPSGFREGCLNPKGLELWQPKEGEWCWFYSSYDSNPLLGKFERYDEYSKYYQLDISKYGKHSHPSNHRFNYCEPFIGELPSFIKDKQ